MLYYLVYYKYLVYYIINTINACTGSDYSNDVVFAIKKKGTMKKKIKLRVSVFFFCFF